MDPMVFAELAATLFMTGLIWFVQIVHYPLYSSIGPTEFPEYQRRHQLLTTVVVGPVMLVEVVAAIRLVYADHVSWLRWLGVALLIVIWLSTAALQVPAHGALLKGFSRGSHAFLVRTNWIRTIAWTVRGLVIGTLACCGLN